MARLAPRRVRHPPSCATPPSCFPWQVSGKIKVNLSADPDGMQAEVEASAYMAELRSEVERLVRVRASP